MKNRLHKKNQDNLRKPSGIPTLEEIKNLPPEEIRDMLLRAEGRIEKETKESETYGYMNQLLEGAELISWQWHITSGKLSFNSSFATHLGYATGEISDIQKWEKLVHPDDLPMIREIMNNHLSGKANIYQAEHRLRHKDGQWIWMLSSCKVVEWDTAGNPVLACGINQNITKNKQNLSELEMANRELSESRRAALNMMEDSILSAQKLEFEHKLFSTFMDTIPSAVFFKDTESRFVSINTALAKRLQTTEKDVIGKTDADFFPADQAKKIRDADLQIMRTGQTTDIEEHLFGLWIRTIKAPRYDETGKIIGVYGISIDITEQKQTQDALRKSEKQYRELIENLTTGFALHEMIYDEQGNSADYRFLQVNPAYERLTGLKAKDIIGHTVKEVIPDIEPYWIESFGNVAKTGESMEHENYVKSLGKYFGTRTFRPAPDQFAVIIADTTERRRIQDALRENEERLRTTLDSIGDAVISVNIDGIVSSINRTAESLTGWSKEKAIGQPVGSILNLLDEQTRQPIIAPVETTLNSGRISNLPANALLLSETGVEIPINDSCAPIIDTSGNITGAVLVFRDQTAERQAIRALEASEANLKQAQALGRMGSWDLDLETGTMVWSDELFHIFGRDPNGATPTMTDVMEQIHPDDRESVTTAHRIILQGRSSPPPVEHRILMQDGTVKTVSVQREPIFDDNNNLIKLVGTTQDISEQKRARQALEESETNLKKAQEIAKTGSWKLDLATAQFFWSNEVYRIFDKDPNQFTPTFEKLLDMTLSDDRHALVSEYENPQPHGNIEHRIVLKGGSVKTLVEQYETTYDADGTPISAVGTVQDVTEQRRAQRALEESEARFRDLLEKIDHIPVQGYNEQNEVIYWNAASTHVYGYTQEEALGKNINELIIPLGMRDDVSRQTKAWQAGGPPIPAAECILQDKNGNPVSVYSSHIMHTTLSGQKEMFCVDVDLRELKAAQTRLQQSNTLLRTILDSMPSRVWWKDLDSRFLGANLNFAREFGLSSPNEMIGKNDYDLCEKKEADHFVKDDREVIESGKPKLGIQEQLTLPSGNTRWIETNKVPLKDPDGHIIGTVGSFADITERKRLQETIEKRILALTRPLEDEEAAVAFEDLFDINELQRIQNEFCNATGVAAVISDPNGYPITQPSNFTRFCMDVVRKTEKGCANCLKSDAALGRHNPDGPTVQPCLSGGLWDAGVSIEVGGHHIANWLIGQVRDETQTEEQMIAYAREIGADEDELIEAFREVPVMQKEQFESVAQALYTLVNQISVSAYQNLQQARFITEQKEAEAKLRKLSEEQSLILNNNTLGIALIRNQICEWANPRLAKMLGVSTEQIENQSTRAYYANEEDYDEVVREAYQTLKKDEQFDTALRFRHANGSIFWCRVTGKALNPNEPSDGSIWMFEDITERKQAESELRRLSTAIEQSPEPVVITDTGAIIQYVNPAFEKSTGFSREEVIGKPSSILKSGKQDAEFYKQMWASLAEGKTWEGRLINRKKDGTLYTEELSIAPVRGPDGQITNYVAVKRDITQELVRNEQMKQAQKMEAVGQLAGGIAHDFNNILQAILGFSELLLMSLDDSDEEQKDSVLEIQNAAKHAADLTRQLLVFSRKEQGTFEQTDLNRIVKNTTTFINSIIGENVQLNIELHSSALSVLADSRQLERAILNMAINARDAMPNGGSLTLETTTNSFSEATATANPKIHAGEFACLRLSDTGIGMTKETVERIFEPFFSTKAPGKGTGLGLAALYGIIQEHKGWINVYSEIGKGTVFSVYLPLCCNESQTAQVERNTIRTIVKTGKSQRILLVEDDLSIRSMTRGVLVKAGYSITCAPNAEAAEQMFQENNGDFALLISDYILPNKTGGELGEILKAIKPDLPVIICSGYSGDRVNRVKLEQQGFSFIEKPYSIATLLNLVQKIFKQPDH